MDREAKDGLVTAYIHGGGRIGVLVEVNCETTLWHARGISHPGQRHCAANRGHASALHQAGGYPASAWSVNVLYIAPGLEEGKPEAVVDRIVEGRMEKFYKEACLLEQEFIATTSRLSRVC
jgi:elongation factor Ts